MVWFGAPARGGVLSFFFFSSRRRHTRSLRDWSSDVCSSDLTKEKEEPSPAFQFILGNAYYAAGDNAKTEASYRSAVERYPTFLRAWNNLGVLYYTTERSEERRVGKECRSRWGTDLEV